MGAWESNGYGKVVDPFWDNKEKSSGGGGGDLPEMTEYSEDFALVCKEENGEYVARWTWTPAVSVAFNRSHSGLNSNNVQGAIDEIAPWLVPSGGSDGQVLMRKGTIGYEWGDAGGSGITIFDGDVEVASGSTGYFVREIPLLDRIELCDGVHAKYKTLTIEASYVRSRPEDEKTETVNISRTFDLERLLIGDAQTYNDPTYDNDDTAHVVLRNDELVERMGGEKYLLTTLQINQNGTDPENDIYTGKLFRITFSYYTMNNGNSEYINLPKEQKVRVKVTAK